MEVRVCETCNTPLDAGGGCVTCAAKARGLQLVSRSGYSSVREMLDLLDRQGLHGELEQVPARREEEKQRPLWNLYVPEDEVSRAGEFLRKDWAEMLGGEEALRAAERGTRGVDLDAGGEIECPACGHRFVLDAAAPDCPDCGLALGAPAEASPDEAEH